MLNKIKLGLMAINTVVIVVILAVCTCFMYVVTSYSLNSTVDNDLINMGYQTKRFSDINYQKKKGNLHINQDFTFFEEKLTNSKIMVIVFDDDLKKIYSKGKFFVSTGNLKQVALTYFANGRAPKKTVTEKDGIYSFANYKDKNISLRTCTTVSRNEKGELELILTAQETNKESALINSLVFVLVLTIIVGSVLSVIGANIIADRSLIPIKTTMDNQKQFIADASHELRTPIAVIKTNLELVLSNEEEKVKEQKTWLNYATKEASRMDKIVGDLLFLSRADLNQIPFNFENIDIIYLIKDAIEMTKGLPKANDITMLLTSKYENVYINADKNKITQLIMILLDNSIKYSKGDNKRIIVNVDIKKNDVVIKVTDNGVGISEEDIDKVFTRFYRVDKSRNNTKGSGLGLSIAQWIVKNHNGQISIESTLGEETNIIITMPFSEYKEI